MAKGGDHVWAGVGHVDCEREGMSAITAAKFSMTLENLKTSAGWVLLVIGTLVVTHSA